MKTEYSLKINQDTNDWLCKFKAIGELASTSGKQQTKKTSLIKLSFRDKIRSC